MTDASTGTPTAPAALQAAGRWPRPRWHFYDLRRVFDAPTQANPLFRRDVRRVAWWHRPALQVRLVLWPMTVALAAWGSSIGLTYYASLFEMDVARDLSSFSAMVLMFLGALAVLSSVLLDARIMLDGAPSVVEERTTGRWDLLRTTPLPVEALVAGKVAALVAQTWPLVLRLIGVRLGVLAATLLAAFVGERLVLGAAFYPLLWRGLRTGGWDVWAGVICLVSLSLMMLLEPAWHARASATLGVAISAQAGRMITAMMTGWVAVIVQWVIRAVVLWYTFWLLLSAALGGQTWLATLLVGLVAPPAVWGFYRLIRWRAWHSALHHVGRSHEGRR